MSEFSDLTKTVHVAYISRIGNALLGEICGGMIPKQCERDFKKREEPR
jgi:hypothetical protein